MTCTRPLEDNEHGALCGDEGRLCDACEAQAIKDHAYLRGADPRFVFGADAQPATEFEYEQEMRDAGRGHLLIDNLERGDENANE